MNPENLPPVTDETARTSVDAAFKAAAETDENSAHPDKMVMNGMTEIGGRVPAFKEVHDDKGNSITKSLTPELNVSDQGISPILSDVTAVAVKRHGQRTSRIQAALDGSGGVLLTRYDRHGKVESKGKYRGAGPKTAQKVVQASALAIKDSAEARIKK